MQTSQETAGAAALELDGVTVWVADGGARQTLLDHIDWRVQRSEHWVVLGPNGAGKSTLLAVAGARRHASAGTTSVLGRRLGRTDVRELWTLIGSVDAELGASFSPRLTAFDVVLTGASASTRPFHRRYGPAEHARARELIEVLGCEPLAARRFATCSSGERQRFLIARALMPRPALLLLDEPSTGLDLPAREGLLGALGELARSEPALATVTVTHHVEDIPASTTHALLLAGGRPVAHGPIAEVLTPAALSRCFGLEIELTRAGGRYAARARAGAVAEAEAVRVERVA